jgi:hypothetical protein
MAYVAVDPQGNEYIFGDKPKYTYKKPRIVGVSGIWELESRLAWFDGNSTGIMLPTGTIKKLLDKKLTFRESPVYIGLLLFNTKNIDL